MEKLSYQNTEYRFLLTRILPYEDGKHNQVETSVGTS